MLLDTFPARSDLALVLAGPDQIGWEKELRARVRPEISSQAVFTGMLEGEMKQGALAAADAFVLPSHQENFGMAVVESLAAGVPVLISNRVNIWREIQSDRAGYIEPDDLPGTARLLQRWQNTSEAERATMRQNAQCCFSTRFHIDRAVDSLLEILAGDNTTGPARAQ